MSRGLGHREQLILHHVYHEPRTGGLLRWGFNPRGLAVTRSDQQSLSRAARGLVQKGLVRQEGPYTNNLWPVDPMPVSVARCTVCAQLATLTGGLR
jgi:hypothetical protein